MNIAVCSLLLPEEKHLSEKSKERLSGISLHKLGSALIEGLDLNLDEPVTVFNIINTLNYPKFPALIFPKEKWKHNLNSNDLHIGYINLIGIKYITQYRGLYKELKKWVKSKKGKPCTILVHHIYYPSMKAACKIKKNYGNQVSICLMTGDMNGKNGLNSQFKPNLKQKLLHIVENKIDVLAKQFDSYIFATKDMAQGFGVEDKPFTVLECTYNEPINIVNVNDKENSLNKEDNKIIFYAGALRDEYGIGHLLRAFSLIKKPNYRLWLAGGGNAENMIKEYVAKDKRIEFLGFIPPKEVNLRQKNATILISPRTSELEFVKYSFPSKTMECLASGKPYIAHRLPCDPIEYESYIQYPYDETDESLKEKIEELCELSQTERNIIGRKSQIFIIEEKNPKKMCKKILDMFKEVYDKH